MDSFPVLSLTTFAPVIGAAIILFIPGIEREQARVVALAAMLVSFVLSVLMLFKFKHNAEFQFTEHVTWLSDLGASYSMGIDGIALVLIALTTLIGVLCVIWSWNAINYRGREYYITLLLLQTGMLGVFMALDLFLFYIFWELMLIPMALLIGIWGSEDRVFAATKFFLYTLLGSLLMLLGIVATYQWYYDATGVRTLNILDLQQGWDLGAYSAEFQGAIFAAFFIAFAIKIPLWPFHTWLPDAHVQAPAAASVMLAAVMLKMGGYGILRYCLPLFPEGSEDWAPIIIAMSVIAILYGALVALPQLDFKKLVAYSSVTHMGFVTLGIFTNIFLLQRSDLNGFNGSMMVMLAHGFNTGALFFLVGMIYERAHTRRFSAYGGVAGRIPIYTFFLGFFTFANMALPGTSGFIGEFLALLGAFQYQKWIAALAFLVAITSAWYMLWMYQQVVQGRPFGELPDPGDTELTPGERLMLATGITGDAEPAHAPVSGGSQQNTERLDTRKWPDLSIREIVTIAPLFALTIIFGVYPSPVFHIIEPSFMRIMDPFLRGPLGGG